MRSQLMVEFELGREIVPRGYFREQHPHGVFGRRGPPQKDFDNSLRSKDLEPGQGIGIIDFLGTNLFRPSGRKAGISE
jgi:hypothetical protein